MAFADQAEHVTLPARQGLERRPAPLGGPTVGGEVGQQLGPDGDRRDGLAGGGAAHLVEDAGESGGLAGHAEGAGLQAAGQLDAVGGAGQHEDFGPELPQRADQVVAEAGTLKIEVEDDQRGPHRLGLGQHLGEGAAGRH